VEGASQGEPHASITTMRVITILRAPAGRGRGRQVVSVAKTADLIIIMLDATKSLEQKHLLEVELDAVGVRLNKTKPDGTFMSPGIALPG
jgi:ribosome-interacting GTPase 1